MVSKAPRVAMMATDTNHQNLVWVFNLPSLPAVAYLWVLVSRAIGWLKQLKCYIESSGLAINSRNRYVTNTSTVTTMDII
jgi:hypothetical protein